jgi:hypothetical protein
MLSDKSNHYATSVMNIWNGAPIFNTEIAAMAAEILARRTVTDVLVAALSELREAVHDGLCNGGTPAFDGPERLDKAIVAADAALAKASSP